MPRKKIKDIDLQVLDKDEVSIQELWDVLTFARNLASGSYPGLITPDILNARMKDVSFNPRNMTEEELFKALSNPKEYEQALREIVEYIELVSAPFKRILAYMASHLALDLTYTTTNIDEESEYQKPTYKKDLKIVNAFLDKFDYKYHFRNVIKQLLRNEVYVCAIRNEGEKIVLQELPLNYVKITAKWDYGYLASFNFAYFLQPGVDIRLYPKFFLQKFNEIYTKDQKINYKPSLNAETRGDSRYVYWVDLPPQYGFVFKLDPSITTAVPYYASLVPDLINQPLIRNLQKDNFIASASKMLVGQVPMLKDSKASVKDMIGIDPVTLGKFLALVKSGLSSAVKVASAPLEDMKAISFESDPEMYNSYLQTSISASGVNTPMIYSGKLKANAIESQLSFQSDSLMMEHLYPMFNMFLDYFVNKETKKYKFSFEFEGNDYYLDRQARFDYAMQLANIGIFLPQKIAAARGMKPQTLMRMMEESKSMKYIDMLTPIIPANQMSGNVSDNKSTDGRPTKKDSEISESGSETRSQGANIGRGGKTV